MPQFQLNKAFYIKFNKNYKMYYYFVCVFYINKPNKTTTFAPS
jgi:hypothetical protein